MYHFSDLFEHGTPFLFNMLWLKTPCPVLYLNRVHHTRTEGERDNLSSEYLY